MIFYGPWSWEVQLGFQVSNTIYYKGDTGPFLEVPSGNGDSFFPRETRVERFGSHVGAKPAKTYNYMQNLHHHT